MLMSPLATAGSPRQGGIAPVSAAVAVVAISVPMPGITNATRTGATIVGAWQRLPVCTWVVRDAPAATVSDADVPAAAPVINVPPSPLRRSGCDLALTMQSVDPEFVSVNLADRWPAAPCQ